MGYNAELWGSEGWHFIHFICLNYPDQPTEADKREYKQFFELLPKVMPCPPCGFHFEENMKKHPIRLYSKKELFEWSIDMHNEVNAMNDKRILSYEEAYNEIWKNTKKNVDSEAQVLGSELTLLLSKIKSNRR
jgi:hypothetical protein